MTAPDIARRLPGIAALRDLCRSMAMVEAILEPDLPYRRHGFDAHWSKTRQLAWMASGGGDEYSVVFSSDGVYIRGFDHESPLSPWAGNGTPWPGVLDSVPEVFRPLVEEPSFATDGVPKVTVCLWRESGDPEWRTGRIDFGGARRDDVDGARYLFGFLTDGNPERYRDWAQDYYGKPVDLDAVRHVHALRPLTPEVVSALNPEVTPAQLRAAVEAIGYPRASAGRSA
ncbi:hypothetical protein [Streptomyces sp. PTD5-9]|uniref:hypothetical protein n=1 Tax=Streptomyces sp. PTD5-9 TaxID=3120150 RepID=UPI00300B1B7F